MPLGRRSTSPIVFPFAIDEKLQSTGHVRPRRGEMLFNSFEFLFAFLPIVLAVVFGLRRVGAFLAAEISIIVASLSFFMWWDWRFIGLLVFSIVFNWVCGTQAAKPSGRRWLILGVGTDLAILALLNTGCSCTTR